MIDVFRGFLSTDRALAALLEIIHSTSVASTPYRRLRWKERVEPWCLILLSLATVLKQGLQYEW